MKKFYFFVKTIGTKKVFMFLVMMFCLFVNNVNAQIAVNVTNNTNTTPNLAASYTSLANALTDLNAVSAMSGPITLTLAAGTETTPATGLLLGSATLNPVLNATNTITIIGAGSATILNAGVGTATPASAVPDGILKLVGVDYVTIDGVAFTDTNVTNPASMEVGLGMFKLSGTDGCNNNTIQNCIFNMQRVNNAASTAPMVEGAVGIAMMNSTALASTTVVTVTAASGASSNNRFYSNTINGGNYGIVLRGFAATTPFTLADTNNDIGGLSLTTGNTILNFGGAAAAANPSAGIRIVDQWSANASFNTINNNNGSGVNHVSTLRGIITSGGTSASLNINNNIISVQSGATTSQLDAISNGAGSTAASNTININNNNIAIGYPNVAAAGNTINGIINSSTANTVNINSNTVSQISAVNLAGTGTWLMIEGGSPGGTLNTNNNIVSNIVRTGASGTFRGVKAATPVGLWTCTGNLVENISYSTVASTGSIDGIFDANSATLINISSNIIRNLSTPTTGTINGIRINTITGTHTCNNNQVYNFSTTAGGVGGATFAGISFSVGNLSASGNTIYALNSTGSTGGTGGAITGFFQGGGTTNTIFNNKIYNLSSSSTGVTVYGMNISGGTTNTIYNNIIGDLRASAANLANAIRGIDVASTNANIYNNTVRINATSTGVNFGTSAFNTSSVVNLDLKNNIFINTSVANGTGFTAAYRRSTAVLTAYNNASNNNLFYAGIPSVTNLIFYDGTNSDQTLAAFKARVTPRETLAISEIPTFVSTNGVDATFLHIDTVAPTAIESGGTAIGSVITDFDNNIRQGSIGYIGTGSAPDIGADEFEGVSSTPVCTGTPALANTLTSNNNFCAGASTSLTLDVSYTTLNNTYQWESSANNVAYNPIAGANSASYNAFPLVSTWYRCVVTCTASGFSSTSTPVQVTVNSAVYATIPLSESFETTWTTSCVVAPLGQDTPNNSWRMIRGAADADASWRADNTTTTLSGWLGTSGAYSPISQDGLRSARFHSFNTSPAGTQGMLDLYVDLSTPGTKQLSYWYIAPSPGVDQLDVLLSEDGGLTFNPITTVPVIAPPTTAVTVWTNITASIASVSATSIIRFRGTGDNGSFDIGLDNVTITLPCSGTPTAGTVVSPTSACSGTPFNLSLAGNTSGVGITYQWQSSPDGIAPYTDIVPATSATYSASQTAATFYQCVVTCTNGGATSTTVPVQVTMNALVNCFCPAAVINTLDSEIGNVTFGSLNNGSATPIYSNPTAVNAYTSFTGLPATNIVQGASTAFSLSQVTSGTTFYAAYANVFIDYNGNGVFDLPAERAFSGGPTTGATSPAIPTISTVTGNITIPVTSVTGNVLMRVVLLEGGSNTTPACSPLGVGTTYGEVEDYVLNITPCVAPAITTQPVTPISVCENTAVNLSVVATGTALTYQWKKDTVDIPSATSATYSIPSALVADSGSYTVLVTGGCGSVLSSASTVTVTANSTLPTETISACDSYTWSANGTVYTVGGIYTSTTACVTRTLDLTINTTSSLPTETISACDSYTWSANGTVYTVGGIYTSTTACVTRTLDLTITPSSTLPTETISACDTYTWAANGTVYTVGGIYTSTTACVTRTLDLTINTTSSLPTETISACDSYTWSANGTVYTVGGIYTSTTACVTRTLDLTITPSSTLPTETISACDSYTWSANGTVYTVGGIYTSTTACVTRTLDLTITAATISGVTTQVINGGVAADATIEDIIVTSNGTVTWFASSADATANTNPLAVGTQLVDGNIYYGVTNIGICRSTTLAVTVTVVLGNSSFDLSQLTYYPNPVKDIFNVKYNKEIISVDVYDLTGRKVIEMKPNTLEVQLDMTNLSNAMYIVRLQSVDGMTELKVYKN